MHSVYIDVIVLMCERSCSLWLLSAAENTQQNMFVLYRVVLCHFMLCCVICFSALMKGFESHKKIDLSGNPVLRHYYTNRVSDLLHFVISAIHHSVNSSSHSVNGDIAIQWEWSNFDPSQNPNPLINYDKTLHN